MGLKTLFASVWKESPSRFGVMILCVIVAGLLEGIGFTLFVPLFDQFSKGASAGQAGPNLSVFSAISRPENLIYLVGLILLVFALKNLFLYWQRCFTEKIALDFDARLKRNMIENAFLAEWKYFLSEKYGMFVNAVNTHAEHSANAFRLLIQISGEVLNVAIYCVVGLFISWKAFLFSAAVGALSFAMLRSTIQKSRQVGVAAVNIQKNFHNRTMEDLSGVKFIKANRLEEARISGIRGLIDELNRTHFKSLKYQALVEVLPDFMMACVICCILYVSYVFLQQPAQQVLVLLAVLYRMNRRFVILQISRQRLSIDLPSYDVCVGLIQKSGDAKESAGGGNYNGFTKEIRFDSVCFAYLEEATLKEVSLVVAKNQITAVIGKSGAGKTTFLDLFLGLLKPASGLITVDGVRMDELNLFAFRSRISYVPQEPFMIDGSIEANIRLGRADATDEQVLRAARQAHADEFIQKQPEKYRTVVGDRGVRLSGGQRQRIALARALIRDPEILILDEATSALDNESERMVQKAIHELKGSRTLLMVAHRLSTIENADIIYVLDDGRVSASGTRDELLKSSTIFQTLYSGSEPTAEGGAL